MKARTWLTWILRVFAGSMILALPCVFMPVSWMDAIARKSELGPMPTEPVAIYLARHLSLMYALTGVLLMYMSLDLDRHMPLLRVFAWGLLGFGLVLAWVDINAGMPNSWTFMEAGPVAPSALLLLWLMHLVAKGAPAAGEESSPE